MDGRAKWLNPLTGEEAGVDSIAESEMRDEPAIIRTILRTEYAYELLDKCMSHWADHRRFVYQTAKMLVVAPGIEVAKDYHKYLTGQGVSVLIATSEESTE